MPRKKEKLIPLFEIDSEVEWLDVNSSWLQAVAFSKSKSILYIKTRDIGYAYKLSQDKFKVAKEVYNKDPEFMGRFVSNVVMKACYRTPMIKLHIK